MLAAPLVAFLWFSRNVRPIADDYCFTSGVVQRGVVGYSLWFREQWGSGLVAIALGGLFGKIITPGLAPIGYPVLVGLVLVSLTGVFALTLRALAPFRDACASRGFRIGTATAGGMAATMGYIASIYYYGQLAPNKFLGYSSLFWMSYVVVHLVPIFLLPAYGSLLLVRAPHPRSRKVLLFASLAVFSVFLGSFAPSESAAIAAAVIATGLLLRTSLRDLGIRPCTWLAFGALIFGGAMVAYLSPGRSRREMFLNGETVPPGTALGAVPEGAGRLIWDSVMSSATIVAFAAGILASVVYSVLARPPGLHVFSSSGRKRFSILTALTALTVVALCAATALGEATLYAANYHMISIQACVGLLAVTLGVGAGLLASEAGWFPYGRASVVLGVASLLVIIPAGIQGMAQVRYVTIDRLTRWPAGSVTLDYMFDYGEGEWVRECYDVWRLQ